MTRYVRQGRDGRLKPEGSNVEAIKIGGTGITTGTAVATYQAVLLKKLGMFGFACSAVAFSM